MIARSPSWRAGSNASEPNVCHELLVALLRGHTALLGIGQRSREAPLAEVEPIRSVGLNLARFSGQKRLG
jgi:hypothetical protein